LVHIFRTLNILVAAASPSVRVSGSPVVEGAVPSFLESPPMPHSANHAIGSHPRTLEPETPSSFSIDFASILAQPISVEQVYAIPTVQPRTDMTLPSSVPLLHQPILCLRAFRPSVWGSPTPARRLLGDLAYFDVITVEGNYFCVSATPAGFLSNRASEASFEPSARTGRLGVAFPTLVDLLSAMSPEFTKAYARYTSASLRPLTIDVRQPTVPPTPWAVPPQAAAIANIASVLSVGFPPAPAPSLPREFNEDIQSALDSVFEINSNLSGIEEATPEEERAVLIDYLQTKVQNMRAIATSHGDFVRTAVRVATDAAMGDVVPLGNDDSWNTQVYFRDSVFISRALDMGQAFTRISGDMAAHRMVKSELLALSLLRPELLAQRSSESNLPIHLLDMVVVDYCGERLVAQCLIPGLLQQQQCTKLLYGGFDSQVRPSADARVTTQLAVLAHNLQIRSHLVTVPADPEDPAKPLVMEASLPFDCKALCGSDERLYLLDVARILPPDVNYLDVAIVNPPSMQPPRGQEPGSKSEGPRPGQHRCGVHMLRPELVQAFVEIKIKEHVQAVLQKRGASAKDGAVAPSSSGQNEETSTPDVQQQAKPAPLSAAEPVSSTSAEPVAVVAPATAAETGDAAAPGTSLSVDDIPEFSFELNPDAFGSAAPEDPGLAKDEALLRELAAFLVDTQVPALVAALGSMATPPMDSWMLSRVFHSFGVNMRYLGRVFVRSQDLPWLRSLLASELILRSAKYLLNRQLRNCPVSQRLEAAAAFLSAFFTQSTANNVSASGPSEAPAPTPTSGTKGNKKKSGPVVYGDRHSSGAECVFVYSGSGAGELLWRDLSEEMQVRFGHQLAELAGSAHVGETAYGRILRAYGLNPLALLRGLCMQSGIVLTSRAYVLDGSSVHPAVRTEDVRYFVPVVRSSEWPNASGWRLMESAVEELGRSAEGNEQARLVARKLLEDGLERAVLGYAGPCGDVVLYSQRMTAILLQMGELERGVVSARQTAMLAERVYGWDHSMTLQEMLALASAERQAGRVKCALELLLRAQQLSRVIMFAHHPQRILIDVMLAMLMVGMGSYPSACMLLEDVVARLPLCVPNDHTLSMDTKRLLVQSLRRCGRLEDAARVLHDMQHAEAAAARAEGAQFLSYEEVLQRLLSVSQAGVTKLQPEAATRGGGGKASSVKPSSQSGHAGEGRAAPKSSEKGGPEGSAAGATKKKRGQPAEAHHEPAQSVSTKPQAASAQKQPAASSQKQQKSHK
jgi:hypothetical protein